MQRIKHPLTEKSRKKRTLRRMKKLEAKKDRIFSKKEKSSPLPMRDKSLNRSNTSLSPGDLSIDQDASFALMHLVSMEEHMYMTFERTGESKWLDMIVDIRNKRRDLLKSFFGGKVPEGETWCLAKHALGCSMRFLETGMKKLDLERTHDAENDFATSSELWALFFLLTGQETKGLDTSNVTRQIKRYVGENKRNDTPLETKQPNEQGFFASVKGKIMDLVSCCIE